MFSAFISELARVQKPHLFLKNSLERATSLYGCAAKQPTKAFEGVLNISERNLGESP